MRDVLVLLLWATTARDGPVELVAEANDGGGSNGVDAVLGVCSGDGRRALTSRRAPITFGPVSPNDSSIPYDAYVVEALRGVVARVMKETAARGRLVGEHHFFITFVTQHPGVRIGPALRAQYPEAMKIVLQHVFEDLEADDRGFAVTLRFGGVPERLVVPYGALVEFRDPSVGLALGFPPVLPEPEPEPESKPESKPVTNGNVVTVDFGKKK